MTLQDELNKAFKAVPLNISSTRRAGSNGLRNPEDLTKAALDVVAEWLDGDASEQLAIDVGTDLEQCADAQPDDCIEREVLKYTRAQPSLSWEDVEEIRDDIKHAWDALAFCWQGEYVGIEQQTEAQAAADKLQKSLALLPAKPEGA